ncbi:MAG: hypothetical protein ACHQT8_07105 [Chlamydiales bacterium]
MGIADRFIPTRVATERSVRAPARDREPAAAVPHAVSTDSSRSSPESPPNPRERRFSQSSVESGASSGSEPEPVHNLLLRLNDAGKNAAPPADADELQDVPPESDEEREANLAFIAEQRAKIVYLTNELASAEAKWKQARDARSSDWESAKLRDDAHIKEIAILRDQLRELELHAHPSLALHNEELQAELFQKDRELQLLKLTYTAEKALQASQMQRLTKRWENLVQSVDAMKAKYEKDLKKLSDEIAQLKATLAEKEELIVEEQQAKNTLEGMLGGQTTAIDKLVQDRMELQAQLQTEVDANDLLKKYYEGLTTDLQEREDQVAKLKAERDNAFDRLTKVQELFKTMEEDVQQVKAKAADQDNEFQKLYEALQKRTVTELHARDRENEALRSQLSQTHYRASGVELAHAKKTIQTLTQELEQAAKQLDALENELEAVTQYATRSMALENSNAAGYDSDEDAEQDNRPELNPVIFSPPPSPINVEDDEDLDDKTFQNLSAELGKEEIALVGPPNTPSSPIELSLSLE